MPRHLRLAFIVRLAPKKLGSFEDRILRFAVQARDRGHEATIMTYRPVHPIFARHLEDVGARWIDLGEVERQGLRAARQLGREYDVLHLSLFSPRSRMTLLAYAAWPARVVFVDGSSGPPANAGTRSRLRTLGSKLLDRVTLARLALYVGASEYVTERARARFPRYEARIRRIYNGIDTERFRPPEQGRPAAPVRILTTASLIPEKGVDHLIRGFAAVADMGARLTVVGEGPEAAALRKLANALGVNGVTEFLGMRDDVDALMREAHVFVHPAVWAEAFGLTVAEAMASGCAVVASRVGAIPELIEDGSSGILVPPADDESIAAALRALIQDAALRNRLAQEARRRATELFGIVRCASEHLDACEAVARSPAGS